MEQGSKQFGLGSCYVGAARGIPSSLRTGLFASQWKKDGVEQVEELHIPRILGDGSRG
jgi:hypothetical protein